MEARMNNNCSVEWGSLPTDVWQSILERLSSAGLAKAACVCRAWNCIASQPKVRVRAFTAPWKIKRILGLPSSTAFWHDNSISRFAISHTLTRSDTLPGLALRYQVHATDIRRLNNMMSDHGIYSRERVLIPISNPNILINETCYIELDVYAKREVAVLYPDGVLNAKSSHVPNNLSEKARKRLLQSMKRSLQADDETAEYYLSISNGDIRLALQQFSDDFDWAQRHRVL